MNYNILTVCSDLVTNHSILMRVLDYINGLTDKENGKMPLDKLKLYKVQVINGYNQNKISYEQYQLLIKILTRFEYYFLMKKKPHMSKLLTRTIELEKFINLSEHDKFNEKELIIMKLLILNKDCMFRSHIRQIYGGTHKEVDNILARLVQKKIIFSDNVKNAKITGDRLYIIEYKYIQQLYKQSIKRNINLIETEEEKCYLRGLFLVDALADYKKIDTGIKRIYHNSTFYRFLMFDMQSFKSYNPFHQMDYNSVEISTISNSSDTDLKKLKNELLRTNEKEQQTLIFDKEFYSMHNLYLRHIHIKRITENVVNYEDGSFSKEYVFHLSFLLSYHQIRKQYKKRLIMAIKFIQVVCGSRDVDIRFVVDAVTLNDHTKYLERVLQEAKMDEAFSNEISKIDKVNYIHKVV